MTTRNERVVSTDPGAAEDPRGSGGAERATAFKTRFVSDFPFGEVET